MRRAPQGFGQALRLVLAEGRKLAAERCRAHTCVVADEAAELLRGDEMCDKYLLFDMREPFLASCVSPPGEGGPHWGER